MRLLFSSLLTASILIGGETVVLSPGGGASGAPDGGAPGGASPSGGSPSDVSPGGDARDGGAVSVFRQFLL